jgi:C-terminal peptidase prc
MTKAKLTLALLGVLATMALAPPTRAEEQPGAPATYVIVVGIDKYADPQIKPRAHAESDAKALYDLLTSKDYLGTPHARLLLGKDATHKSVIDAVKWAAENAKGKDTVIFAWFGEGGPLGKTGDRRCYFTSDSSFKERDKTAVGADEIGDIFKDLKAHKLVAFLDVNFKGFDAAGQTVAEPDLSKAPYKEFIGDDESEDHNALPGRIVFMATNGLKPSLDLKDQGVFAKVILDGLKGAADKEGYEPDGNVSVDELTDYLDKYLPELCREHGANKDEKGQLPVVLGGPATHFVLTRNPDKQPDVQKRLTAYNDMVKAGKVPAKFADEGVGLLERMPRLEGQRELRKQYQALVDGKTTLAKFEAKRTEILDGMRITEVQATAWAKKVYDVVDIMKDNHVKETKPGEMVAWAIRGLYRQIDERIPADVEKELKDVKDVKDEEKLTVLLAKARLHLGKREDLSDDKDLSLALRQMLAKLDPYTTFYDKEALEKFKQEIQGNFPGIGIQIRKDAETDYLLVVTPIKGSPAYKAGLQAGDLVTTVKREVDGATGKPLPANEKVLSTRGMLLSDAVKRIKGMANTPVVLTVQREGVAKPFDVEITRGLIEVDTVLGAKRKANDDWDFYIDHEAKIGYLRLTQFSRNSYRDIKNVMDDLMKQGLKGFILDLRFNPGGLLDSAVKITDLYIDDGLIVTIRPRAGRPARHTGQSAGSLLDFPMVCLVNGQSASGSEIVSAALQDHKRALIIGDRSYGKGSVQNIAPFLDGELKLTTATFWRPSGKNLNRATAGKDGGYGKEEDVWGVTPDKVVPLSRKETGDLFEYLHELDVIRPKGKPMKDTGFKDQQLDEALKYLREQIKMASR